ncbi:MAG: DNA replication/repair protein RecF [Myxococcaceae bacterium]
MQLLSLGVRDFRNLRQVRFEPSARASVIVGPNGQGKTNLLEALYFLATLKALRARRLAELVRLGESAARVAAQFLLGGATREIAVDIQPPSRKASVDGKRAATLEDYFGGVSVVSFTPDDLDIVKGSPEQRRHFLDRAVFNRWPAFLHEGRTYARAVKARNRLLKENAPNEYVSAYDQALAQAGARVWVRRRELLSEMAGPTAQRFSDIGRCKDPARFTYAAPDLGVEFANTNESGLTEAFIQVLKTQLPRDRERGFTSLGPHSDDVDIHLGEHPARAFASQGQQRALVLAWKIAELNRLTEVLGRVPMLLLDDVSSELDPERNAFLMDCISQTAGQVVMTTTDANLVRAVSASDTRWFRMAQGELLPWSDRPASAA